VILLARISIRIAKIITLYLSIFAWIVVAGILVTPIFRWLKSGLARPLTEEFLGAPYPAHYLLFYLIPVGLAYGLTRIFRHFENLEPPGIR
jgi:hypothetical protein